MLIPTSPHTKIAMRIYARFITSTRPPFCCMQEGRESFAGSCMALLPVSYAHL